MFSLIDNLFFLCLSEEKKENKEKFLHVFT